MNIKNLIEAVKFQVSVKPQDDFMREVAEGLEKLYSNNMKLLSDYDAACDELKKWQKLQPIGCPACHRGCFSNDKFCPHCGTSLRNSKVPTEKASGTGMTDNEIIKALKCCVTYKQICPETCPMVGVRQCAVGLRKKALDLINRQKEQIESLIAGQETLQKYIAEKDAEIDNLNYLVVYNASCATKLQIKLVNDKSEAVKEFAEKLKENTVTVKIGKQTCKVITVDGIDHYKKEMVGEG